MGRYADYDPRTVVSSPPSPHWSDELPEGGLCAELTVRVRLPNTEGWAASRGIPVDQVAQAFRRFVVDLAAEVEVRAWADGVYAHGSITGPAEAVE